MFAGQHETLIMETCDMFSTCCWKSYLRSFLFLYFFRRFFLIFSLLFFCFFDECTWERCFRKYFVSVQIWKYCERVEVKSGYFAGGERTIESISDVRDEENVPTWITRVGEKFLKRLSNSSSTLGCGWLGGSLGRSLFSLVEKYLRGFNFVLNRSSSSFETSKFFSHCCIAIEVFLR